MSVSQSIMRKSHKHMAQTLTVGNNLQVWAEWHCQIHPHIFTILLGARSLLAYRTHPRPTAIHSKPWINQRITYLIYINTKWREFLLKSDVCSLNKNLIDTKPLSLVERRSVDLIFQPTYFACRPVCKQKQIHRVYPWCSESFQPPGKHLHCH